MANPVSKVIWKVGSLMVVIPAGIMARRAVEKAWVKARHSDPPGNPVQPGVTTLEALTWAAVSGIASSWGRMFAAQTAARTWRVLTGSLPPGVGSRAPDESESQ